MIFQCQTGVKAVEPLKRMQNETLILFCMICQREVVEIVSFSVFTFNNTKIPNPLTADPIFAAINYPSIMLYIIVYILSIKKLIPKPLQKKNIDENNAMTLERKTVILAVGGKQRTSQMIYLETEGNASSLMSQKVLNI